MSLNHTAVFLSQAEEALPDKGLHAATIRAVRCAHALAKHLGRATMLPDGSVLPLTNGDDDDDAPAGHSGHNVMMDWIHKMKVGGDAKAPSAMRWLNFGQTRVPS